MTPDDSTTQNDNLIPLSEDNDTPFSPPTDTVTDASADIDMRPVDGQLDSTHPNTDDATDIDTQQLYDEGLAGAAESSEPNAGNAVVDYDPEKDQRQQ